MAVTRYSEARTLARGLCRLSGQERLEFKGNVLRLRRHFEQFNLDASEVCQWLMGLRPGGKGGSDATKDFWEFFLEPTRFIKDEDQEDSDRYRRRVFDFAAKWEKESSISAIPISRELQESIGKVAARARSAGVEKLFRRLGGLNSAHRQVLLKASAEWIVARYWRGFQNWQRQKEEWDKEKNDWEKSHPELNEPARREFNEIFQELGIKEKSPRLCLWKRLQEAKDNCLYAGERIKMGFSWKSHAGLCLKYKKFRDSCAKNNTGFKEYFVKNAKYYLNLRKNFPEQTKKKIIDKFLRDIRDATWFPKAWEDYLKALGIQEQTILQRDGGLPHCVNFVDDKDCAFNPHTENCVKYRDSLNKKSHLQPLEGLYREWRKDYLSGPKKPTFRYPSRRGLSLPKIFGEGFFRVDFDKSILGLRLDDMSAGEFVPFGFAGWPKDYQPQPVDMEITSVHISFVGTRARAGFHFRVKHREARFEVRQEVIDELRSRKYPRQAQDQKFLDEARQVLLESFRGGDPQQNLKILSVDLGNRGGGAAYFEGKDFRKAFALKIIKLERLYDEQPPFENINKPNPQEEKKKQRQKGLGKEHVGRHLESWSTGEKKISEKRREKSQLGEHDMRRLGLHIRWMIRDWVRLNVSQIIQTAEQNQVDLIVFESMRGFRVPGYDKIDADKKRRLAFLAHGAIRRKTTEKAVERGMRVVTVPYLKSSQLCAQCGQEQQDKRTWERNKRKHRFQCEDRNCGHHGNSDENAARVLGRVFWGEIKLPVD